MYFASFSISLSSFPGTICVSKSQIRERLLLSLNEVVSLSSKIVDFALEGELLSNAIKCLPHWS